MGEDRSLTVAARSCIGFGGRFLFEGYPVTPEGQADVRGLLGLVFCGFSRAVVKTCGETAG